jgi:hypothetical protein
MIRRCPKCQSIGLVQTNKLVKTGNYKKSKAYKEMENYGPN